MSEQTKAPDTAWVGSRVRFAFNRHWSEEGTVTAEESMLLTIQLDETVELPESLGGGWCCEVQREAAKVEWLGRAEGSHD